MPNEVMPILIGLMSFGLGLFAFSQSVMKLKKSQIHKIGENNCPNNLIKNQFCFDSGASVNLCESLNRGYTVLKKNELKVVNAPLKNVKKFKVRDFSNDFEFIISKKEVKF